VRYAFFDFIGDLGGVLEIILLAFGIFINPVAEHCFLLTAANNLFFARCN